MFPYLPSRHLTHKNSPYVMFLLAYQYSVTKQTIRECLSWSTAVGTYVLPAWYSSFSRNCPCLYLYPQVTSSGQTTKPRQPMRKTYPFLIIFELKTPKYGPNSLQASQPKDQKLRNHPRPYATMQRTKGHTQREAETKDKERHLPTAVVPVVPELQLHLQSSVVHHFPGILMYSFI